MRHMFICSPKYQNTGTMNASAIALNRFGLGVRPADAAPADPQRWLLSQLDIYDALPAPWRPLPRTHALLDGSHGLADQNDTPSYRGLLLAYRPPSTVG